MAAATRNLIIDQGSDWSEQIVVKDNGVPRDLTGYSARSQLRASKNTTAITASFVCDIPNPSGGVITMSLPNATSSAVEPAIYYYDLEIYTAADAVVTRLVGGTVTLTAEVTRP